ncbi:regulator of volume decrease after cellular swelling-domain-containing protein [Xylariaceae sp. FL0016]|nr:regulator of volume decrease after cellular swelling-domain-containing protein [Xylariaceae sp. FL0016]
MLPTIIKTCPSAENDFEPLNEYQAQTPETFFPSKPILYYHDTEVKAWAPQAQAHRLQFIKKAPSDDSYGNAPAQPESFALENQGSHVREDERVEVFVASNKLTIFSHSSGTGIEVPYPAITLHAIKNFHHLQMPDDDSRKFVGVYMQLELSDSSDDDDEGSDPIELTLIPYKALPTEQTIPVVDALNSQRTNALFNQISACSNLNPDPRDEEDEEEDETDRIVFEGDAEGEAGIDGLPGVLQGSLNGGLPPPLPGSSGWITADNVHEYFDADGNWIGDGTEEDGVSGELGDGAGRVRARDEVDQDDTNGHQNGEDIEAKRPRTE